MADALTHSRTHAPSGSQAPPPPEAWRTTWRVLDTPPAPGPFNMAVDEVLMSSVAEHGVPVLRFYRWQPACLSLGRNQPARGRYDQDALRAQRIDVARRPTGGRAVLHDRDLTYSAVLPVGTLGSVRESYGAVNGALAAGLRRLGVRAEVAGARAQARAPRPSLDPCFRVSVAGEVVVGGRKLVGSAVHRSGLVLLQHGSLLLYDDQPRIRSLRMMTEPEEVGESPATLGELLDPLPTWEALVTALISGWRTDLGAKPERAVLTSSERRRAEMLVARYLDPAWTWRR